MNFMTRPEYESFIRHPGWEALKKYLESQIETLTGGLLNSALNNDNLTDAAFRSRITKEASRVKALQDVLAMPARLVEPEPRTSSPKSDRTGY